jgi:mannitol/fructose-specific phosphotransferase system IIA component (Ntr-type)
MKNILNQLIQLQELNFALAEEKASSSKMPLKQLEDAIAEIQASLPSDVSTRYRRLQERFQLAVAPIINNTCSQCGLAVPPAVVNDARAGKIIQSCPHCGRFLYFPDTMARRIPKPKGAARTVEAGIARFSAKELMVPKLAATTREEAIAELASVLAESKFIENPESVNELALRREAIVSTAVEHGLAFPHVRNVEGGSLAFALGLKESGLKFGAPDSHLTKIIFLIVIPPPSSAFYLRLLAGLVKTFSETDARKALLECDTPDAMWKTLTKLTKTTVP